MTTLGDLLYCCVIEQGCVRSLMRLLMREQKLIPHGLCTYRQMVDLI